MKNCLFINNKWMISCSLLALAYAGDVMAMYDSESNISQSSSNLVSSSNDSSQRNKVAQNRVREMSPDEYEQWISAAKKDDCELIESFIKKGVNVNQVQGGESPALLYAAGGNIKMVKLLVENGADVNLKDDDGDTPLGNAVYNLAPEIVEYLLKKNADVKLKNKEGITPLMTFLKSFRVKWGGKTSSEDLKKIAKLLVDFGADVNEHGMGEKKYSLLTYALRFIKNPKDFVIYLVEHGADVGYEDQDESGMLVKWLDDGKLYRGEFRKGLIGTPLEIAKAQGYTEIVDYLELMEKNKTISSPIENKNNRKNSNNHRVREMSPDEYEQWISAAKKDDCELIESFIKKGVNVNQVQGGESPALLYAAGGNIKMVKLLVENGADVNLKDDDGDTPLGNAVYNLAPEIVEYLLKKNADVKLKNKEGITPLMTFLKSFRVKWGGKTSSEDLKKIAKLLVDFGADVNEHGMGEKKYSLLTYALRFIKNPKDFVIYLVEHGADVGYEDQDESGMLVKWLDDGKLYRGEFRKGLIGTPLEIAKAQGYTEIVDYLELMEKNKIISFLIENKNNRKNSNNKGEED